MEDKRHPYSRHYPDGEYYDPRAPWNQYDPEMKMRVWYCEYYTDPDTHLLQHEDEVDVTVTYSDWDGEPTNEDITQAIIEQTHLRSAEPHCQLLYIKVLGYQCEEYQWEMRDE